MWKTDGFWDGASDSREYCYRIVPLRISSGEIVSDGFEIVYQALGKIGYKFRDAGHNAKKVIISLNKPISKKHLGELEKRFQITKDSGTDLAFI